MHLMVYYKCSHCKYNIIFGNEAIETHLFNLTMKIEEKDYEAQIACICLKDHAFETNHATLPIT